MILSEQQSREVFGSRTDILRECIEFAWDRYLAMPPEIHVDLTPRSRASIVHDFIVSEARKRFFNDSGVQLVTRRGLFTIDFGEVQLRFKKFNGQLRPQSIPTNQTRAFMIQEELPGLPLPTKLTAGYKLDNIQQNIECIAVVCFSDDRCAWFFELERLPKVEPVRFPHYPVPVQPTPKARAKEGTKNENIKRSKKQTK